MDSYLLAIDQGTTNSRAIIFNSRAQVISQHELPLTQFNFNDGWVEQDPEEMFNNTVICCQEALAKGKLSASSIAAIGIANQRETTIVWEKSTGKAIHRAIVWQDRRTSQFCNALKKTELDKYIKKNTGLLLDPYFSASKICWLLDNIPHARAAAEAGELLFGTVDTYLLWKLTGGKIHATDATNASRTLLFNIHTQTWDNEILNALKIPNKLLPTVFDNTADFGTTTENLFGIKIPITAMIGDQQAATVGQTCFLPGMVKATYGTGAFMLLNTGQKAIQSQQKLITTIAYRLNNQVTYGLEGSIFSAGTSVKWLRDTLKMITLPSDTETHANSLQSTGGVYLIPAFTGLGAPHWNPNVRAALVGLTADSGIAHIARAALESVVYQTRDLLSAMNNESKTHIQEIRVDGGMTVNNWFLQFLADLLQLTVARPKCTETTAMGAAFLAGLQAGVYSSLEEIANLWQLDAKFSPHLNAEQAKELYLPWQQAVARLLK